MAMQGRPKIAETPLELLSTPGIEPGLINKYYAPVVTATIFFGAVIIGNYASRRPVMSGIQKHILATAAGAAAGFYAEDYRSKKLADRDAVLRHYVELHPEDFPPYERKKYRDVFEKWIPIR
ncbi:NADH dehydrogenase [ubiquinone] 1 subunit C2 [Anthonomus grandis grandis]|uniref:NADH dehydrogenase [ubiquinone] 1 subunit C2 n=1 Tax=Anthonomus grandis grandis TaxID=2921223 RepID=UPI00216646CB|nr:NADH dehydrogenase [ubiquinone] 1 subunit C2 [Anthonomus grandis grandis]